MYCYSASKRCEATFKASCAGALSFSWQCIVLIVLSAKGWIALGGYFGGHDLRAALSVHHGEE